MLRSSSSTAGGLEVGSLGPYSICLITSIPPTCFGRGRGGAAGGSFWVGGKQSHNKLCKFRIGLTMRASYCYMCLGGKREKTVFGVMVAECDRPSMKINGPYLTDREWDCGAERVIHHTLTGVIQSDSSSTIALLAVPFFCRLSKEFNNIPRIKTHSL